MGSGEGYPAGNGSSISAAALLLRLTGAATLAAGAMLYGDGDATLATLSPAAAGNVLLSAGAAAPAWGKVALTTHVSGILPAANGGTGVNNAGTITTAANISFTGAGSFVTGGFTLTVPATGTATLLEGTQTLTGAKTFSALITASTYLGSGAATIIRSSAAGVGWSMQVTGDTVDRWRVRGDGTINWGDGTAATDVTLYRTGSAQMSLIGSLVFASSGTSVVVSSTTDATSSTAASVTLAGGLAVAKNIYTGGSLSQFGVGGTSTFNSILVLNGSSASDYGAALRLNRNSVNQGSLGTYGSIFGGASNDITLRSVSGVSIRLTNNSTDGVTVGASAVTLGMATTISNRLTITHGSIATDLKTLDSSVTWNAGGVTFTGWKLNVTNTASNAASLLLDLQVGGASKASVGLAGNLSITSGSLGASAPLVSGTQTWNSGGVTFTGLFMNITDTASAGGSLLIDAMVASNSMFSVGKSGNVTAAGAILSKSSSGGIGYLFGSGAGGSVTQVTSKATGVTLNTLCGVITMHNASLAAATGVGFTVTNSNVTANDTIIVGIGASATADSYTVTVDAIGSGSFRVSLRNVTAGALGEAVQLRFAVIKGCVS